MITIFKNKLDIPNDMEYIECGNNALEILYHLEKGYVYSEYALIPFTIDSVMVETRSMKKIISDYEELKEWWEDEK